MKTYRIAYARIMHETNSFSTVPTTLADFKRTHFIEGDELHKVCTSRKEWEVKQFLRNLELSGFYKALRNHPDKKIEAIPLLSAWSIPGGPVAHQDFEQICERLRTHLEKAGKLDGVFLALHGAMGVEDNADPETTILKVIREVVGENVPIAVTMDLHGNLTRAKVDELTFLCAYRTNPHWDMHHTGYRAGNLLIRTICGEIKPSCTWRALPLLLGGSPTMSFLPPMLQIFQRMKQIEADPRVLDCSLFMCHPFLDNPDLGWSVYVITDNEPALAEAIADELAERCWRVRKKQPPKFHSAETIIEKVRKAKIARKFGSIAVCDTSDVVGAGSTGENTAFLKVVMAKGRDLITYIPLRDPEAVEELWPKELKSNVEITVGGKLQPEVNEAVKIRGQIIHRAETENFGRVIVLESGKLKLVLTEGYALPMKPGFYEDVGLDVRQADLVIVKNFFHFQIYYFTKSRKYHYMTTKGITDLDMILQVKTNYPAYPKDDISDWREIDRQKRGLSGPVKVVRAPLQKQYLNKKNLAKFLLLLLLLGIVLKRRK